MPQNIDEINPITPKIIPILANLDLAVDCLPLRPKTIDIIPNASPGYTTRLVIIEKVPMRNDVSA